MSDLVIKTVTLLAAGGVFGTLAPGYAWDGPAGADTTGDAGSGAGLQSILEEMDQRAAGIDDVTARFEERKYTSLLKEPLVSRGVIRMVGSRSVWETESPHRTVTLITPEEVRIYYPDRAVVEAYEVGGHLGSLAVSPVPRLETLKDRFRIERILADKAAGNPNASRQVALRLTPRAEQLSQHVEGVEVLLDRQTSFVRRAEVVDPDGDRTVLLFSDVRVNTGLDADDVALELPPGTAVHRPLAGASRGAGPSGDRR